MGVDAWENDSEERFLVSADGDYGELVIGKSGRIRHSGQKRGKKRDKYSKSKKGKKGKKSSLKAGKSGKSGKSEKSGKSGKSGRSGKGAKGAKAGKSKNRKKSKAMTAVSKKKKKSKSIKDLAKIPASGPKQNEMTRLAAEIEGLEKGTPLYFITVAQRTLCLPTVELEDLDEELLVHWVFPSSKVLDEYYEKSKVCRNTVVSREGRLPSHLRAAVERAWKEQTRGMLEIPSGPVLVQFCHCVLDVLAHVPELSKSMDSVEEESVEKELTKRKRSTRLILKDVEEQEGRAHQEEIQFKSLHGDEDHAFETSEEDDNGPSAQRSQGRDALEDSETEEDDESGDYDTEDEADSASSGGGSGGTTSGDVSAGDSTGGGSDTGISSGGEGSSSGSGGMSSRSGSDS